MGQKKPDSRLNFNRKLKLEFHRAKIIIDFGLLGFTKMDNFMELRDFWAKIWPVIKKARASNALY